MVGLVRCIEPRRGYIRERDELVRPTLKEIKKKDGLVRYSMGNINCYTVYLSLRLELSRAFKREGKQGKNNLSLGMHSKVNSVLSSSLLL